MAFVGQDSRCFNKHLSCQISHLRLLREVSGGVGRPLVTRGIFYAYDNTKHDSSTMELELSDLCSDILGLNVFIFKIDSLSKNLEEFFCRMDFHEHSSHMHKDMPSSI